MTLRRRLLLFSAPVALLLVVVIVKSVSVVVAGNVAATAYAERDDGALRTAVDTLSALNVIEPTKAPFAAGALAVLDDRLEEADRQFSASLAVDGAACETRVNLELVRETLGDRAAAVFDADKAVEWYLAARAVVAQAQPGCFAGNSDPDAQRRLLRHDAMARLDSKIAAVSAVPPPPPPSAATAGPPPSVPSPGAPDNAPPRLRLDPGAGPPLDRLQQILRDAASVPSDW